MCRKVIQMFWIEDMGLKVIQLFWIEDMGRKVIVVLDLGHVP